MSDMPSTEQVEHNQRLCDLYPLGQIDAMWTLVEHLADSVGRQKYVKEIDAILGAIQDLDTKMRAERFPLKKAKLHVRANAKVGKRGVRK